MKKLLFFISTIIFIFIIFLFNTVVYSSHNEIIDFESLSNLELFPAYNKQNINLETNKGVNNSKCISITHTSSGLSQFSYTFTGLDDETRYSIDIDCKASNVILVDSPENFGFGIQFWLNDVPTPDNLSAKTFISGSFDYKTYTISGYPKNGELKIVFELRNSTGTAYFDNIILTPINTNNIVSDKGNILLKADNDIINAFGSVEDTKLWVNQIQLAYDDLNDLTSVIPTTQNNAIIIDLLSDDEVSLGIYTHSSEGGIIYFSKSQFITNIQNRKNIGTDTDWIFAMLYQLGLQFNFSEAWTFERTLFSYLQLAYVLDKNEISYKPNLMELSEYEILKEQNLGIEGSYKWHCDNLQGYLGEGSFYSNGIQTNYSTYGAAYTFLQIKNEIGWDAFKYSFELLHSTYGKNNNFTNLEKFNLFITTLSNTSQTNIQSLFSTKEWNSCIDYCGGYSDSTVTKVILDKENVSLNSTSNITLNATLSHDIGGIDWTSSNPHILKVIDGILIPIKNGSAIITARSQNSGELATCNVLVNVTPPSASVVYSTTELTNNEVIVQIQVNEKCAIENGNNWIPSNNFLLFSKIFHNNSNETIIIKNEAGNTSQISIQVNNIDTTPAKIDVTYSSANLTKDNVTVTITSDKEIKKIDGWNLSSNKKILPVDGWKLSDDDTILTKTYKNNINETIVLEDLLGNTIDAIIDISNIDKISPKANVEYIKENNMIIAKITSNEEIKILSGWLISENNKVLQKTYSTNLATSITIEDIAGNTTIVPLNIKIDNEEKDSTLSSNKILPNAGKIIYITILPILIIISFILYKKHKKYTKLFK